MDKIVAYFQQLIYVAVSLYFKQESEYADIRDVPQPQDEVFGLLVGEHELSFEERIVLLLALMPHISPQTLDIFFVHNKDFDRPYTEFGGWKGLSHGGFLPTGETAAFIVSVNVPEKRQEVIRILGREHWFYKKNILRCEGQGEGEPFLSGRLVISDEVLAKPVHNIRFEHEYSMGFPARRITTALDWNDLVLPYHLSEELENILLWLEHQQTIRTRWQLDRIIKPGYRSLFYGPPGTGKTLTAMLLGKQNNMDVYRVDLSMIVSKYIGETEKNLAKIFDCAQHQNWILFFDEADALFGQRTETQSSNDRHANQEVAYLLQRIEDFPGMVILATNLKDNIDEAFFRRFQSSLYFPMPDQYLRYELWKKMLPPEWLDENKEELLHEAAEFKLSGGSMVNVIQSCAIKLYKQASQNLTVSFLQQAIQKELSKEGIAVEKSDH
ncbi:MAG: ftsH 2 [Bacteroidetes bacterium]|nr:ftsH 2 [Bacteroidota bacterium]